jgi:hypothetical protein
MRWLGLTGACITVLSWAAGPAAAAEGDHVLDPVLSLTGSCKTTLVDPVPDPPVSECEAGSHPPVQFTSPRAVTTDSYGNIYVSNYGSNASEGKAGRVDVFDPEGFFITGLKVEGATNIAVDSAGTLYVVERPFAFLRLSRFIPTTYKPATGEISYNPTPQVVAEDFIGSQAAITVNPLDDHLFILYGSRVVERSSAAEGNTVVSEIGKGVLSDEGSSVAIDASRNRLYTSDTPGADGVVRVFELAAPHNLVDTFDGSETPAGELGIQPAIAADEATGNIFVFDGGEDGAQVLLEFDEEGKYLSTFGEEIQDIGNTVKIWVDNGANSPNGALNLFGRYVFAPSHPTGLGHSFAYGPSGEAEPKIESLSVAEVTREDAELRATINPGNLPTEYTFEYITQQRYEEEGNTFNGALTAGSGQIPAGQAGVQVSTEAGGLSPETSYRFRVVAANSLSIENESFVSAEGEFTTYPPAMGEDTCANDALRTGPSALLPDCRAYELVTPSDTNARSPIGLAHLGVYFPTLQASPAGDKVSFQIQGGTLPGYEGTGSFGGDPYLSSRTPTGWTTTSAGPNGEETAALLPGSVSPDQGYSFWSTGSEKGTAVIPGGEQTNYVRYPDGHSELVGRGSLTTDPRVDGRLISENGGHIIFISGGGASAPAVQLEENAPPDGTVAIYDYTSDGVTHVVSLLPGDETPQAKEDALYGGASFDGEGVAFSIGNTLYLRHDNDETYEIGVSVTPAGIAEGGERIFFVEGGDLMAFDVEDGVIPFSTTGDVTPVNVSADGSAAYFVSPSVLPGEPNPSGDEPAAGEENLYLSREGQITFVGTVTQRDVDGAEGSDGLGLWTVAVDTDRVGIDPSRSTPDGSVLLFQSRAELTGYDPEGHVQVFRFDAVADELDCLSCNPTGAQAAGDGTLQSFNFDQTDPQPLNDFDRLTNIRADGRRAIFQSEEALVPEDTDGLQDVYQWEDSGVGTCNRAQGCVSLISSGQSARIDYLYAISDSGNDVFFRSSDLLVGADADETPSIYDARVNGGFPEPEPQPCQDSQVCRPSAPSPPSLQPPVTGATGPSGNVPGQPKTCPKGKRKVKKNGKVRCVKKKRQGKQQRKAGTTKKGGQK